MRSRWRGALGALALAGFASGTTGCSCGQVKTQHQFGEVGVLAGDGSGLIARDVTYDFGVVTPGTKKELTVEVRDLGDGTFELVSAEKRSGDAVRIGASGDADPVFDVAFVAGATASTSEPLRFTVTYQPSVTQMNAVHEAVVVFHAGNTRPGEDTATLHLHGGTTALECGLPQVIDFGIVARGSRGTRTLELPNHGAVDTLATVGDPTGHPGDDAAFTHDVGSARGVVTLPAHLARTVSLSFSPTESRAYESTLHLTPMTGCAYSAITLRGSSVDALLTWAPSALEFGVNNAGTRLRRPLTFTNHTASAVTVSALHTTLADYTVLDAAGAPTSTLVVPALGVAAVTVELKVAQLGSRGDQLTFVTDLVEQPTGSVPLHATGGGPDIATSPAAMLDFGNVIFVQASMPALGASRRVAVSNVGTPSPAGQDWSLRLGHDDGAGHFVAPYVELTPLGTNTAATEFSVSVPTSGPRGYDASAGLEARAGVGVDLQVTVTPSTTGSKDAQLHVYSNDPDQPDTIIVLHADAQAVPPCVATVTPAALDFGALFPGQVRDLTVTITNLGTSANEVCVVSGVELATGSDPAFALPAGAIATQQVLAGQALSIPVRITAPNSTTLTSLVGQLELSLSSPTLPHRSVPLQALVAPVCVTVTVPSFGSPIAGCGSQVVSATVSNGCAFPVTVTSAVISNAAGLPAGSSGCPGSIACPEFTVSALPSSGVTLAPTQTTQLSLKYAPLDVGTDTGALSLVTTISGQPRTETFALTGTGAMGSCGPPANCFPLAVKTVVPPSPVSGLPYSNVGNNVTGWTQVPSAQGAGMWSSSGTTLDGVGYFNFIPVVANSFTLEADLEIGQSIADFQMTLWDSNYAAGYKISLGPADGDTPYFGLMKLYDDPAHNVYGRPYGDDLAIFCAGSGSCNTSTTEPNLGDVKSLNTATTSGYPSSGTWFHFKLIKTGGMVSLQVNSLPPLVWSSQCLDVNWKIALGSWADVHVKNLTVQ